MTFTDEQQRKLAVAQEILGYRFAGEQLVAFGYHASFRHRGQIGQVLL